MKNLKNNLFSSLLAFVLMAGMLSFSQCDKNDEGDPCELLECLNGGTQIAGADNCHCDCPDGYSGTNCEKSCPVTVECPIGKTPNPDNGCICE